MILFTTLPSWKIKHFVYWSGSDLHGIEFYLIHFLCLCMLYYMCIRTYMHAVYVQFNSVAQLCPTLYEPMNRSIPGLPVRHQLSEFTQTHVTWVGDAIQPSHPLLSPSPPALNLSQHEGLLQWVSSSHEVAKVLEFQLQHQSLQWTPRTDLL